MILWTSFWGPQMRDRIECPKCRATSAWYVQDYRDVMLRCLCGYYRVVATKLEEMVIEHIESTITLPRRYSKLWYCVAHLFSVEPANSQEITEALNYGKDLKLTVSDVSSQLTVLRYKGLVHALDEKKGWPGGSTWCLTDVARERLSGGRCEVVDKRRKIIFRVSPRYKGNHGIDSWRVKEQPILHR